MAKTWKDLPRDASGYKPFRKRIQGPLGRKKLVSDKLKEVTETEVLKWFNETCENEYEAVRFRDPWNA